MSSNATVPADPGQNAPPLEWRTVLAEIFAEAERKGLGTFQPGFDATPGLVDAAADFIESRAQHLADHRFGSDDTGAA